MKLIIGSPVTFGREECVNTAISSSGVDATNAMSSSGVDAVIFWLIMRAGVAPYYDEY
jgi:hypothetical protein